MANGAGPDRPDEGDKERIGPYEVEETLAAGALNVVLKVRSRRSGASVCLKLMTTRFAGQKPVVDRFVGSARALMGVQLPHVATVRDLGEHEGRPYIVTDLVGGRDLGQVVSLGALRPGAGLSYLRQAARGLQGAASLGQLHGDLRPGHLMMQRGEVFVVGFGRSLPWTTAQGRQVWGDAAYLAPEVSSGRRPDVRSDIYALGCTFYELLTGRPPFGSSPPDALLACHAHEPFPSARALAPHVPEELDRLLQRMGAKNANGRPQSYAALLEEVAALAARLSAGTGKPPILIVEAGRQAGASLEIPEGELLLGRTPGEGFFVDDGRISRRHAKLHRSGQRVEVEDLGSKNGVKVNGTRSDRVVLRPGDRIRLGDTVLRVEDCEGEEGAELIGAEGMPSSPVRGAFGASEVVHSPARQLRIGDLDADAVVPQHFKAVAHLARGVARERSDRRAVLDAALSAARDVVEADEALLVPIDNETARLSAATADEAQVLSCVLPAIERALPGHLSLLTSVRADREGAWSVALAPVRQNRRALCYLVLVRRSAPIQREALDALELLADAAAPAETAAPDPEPTTQNMDVPPRP